MTDKLKPILSQKLDKSLNAYQQKPSQEGFDAVWCAISTAVKEGYTVILKDKKRDKHLVPGHVVRTLFKPLMNEPYGFIRYADKKDAAFNGWQSAWLSDIGAFKIIRVKSVMDYIDGCHSAETVSDGLALTLSKLKDLLYKRWKVNRDQVSPYDEKFVVVAVGINTTLLKLYEQTRYALEAGYCVRIQLKNGRECGLDNIRWYDSERVAIVSETKECILKISDLDLIAAERSHDSGTAA